MLSIGEKEVASWRDDKTQTSDLKVEVKFNDSVIQSGATLSDAGTLSISVTDEGGNCSIATIKIICQGIFGLENLRALELKVDEEVNLLQGVTFAEGVSLARIEFEINGITTVVGKDGLFTPEYPAECLIRFILTTSN